MEANKIRAALSRLDAHMETAREAKNQMEYEVSGAEYPGPSYFENPKAALVHELTYISNFLAITLEIAGLPETRSRLLQQWDSLERSKGGIGDTDYFPEFDYLESKPFDYLITVIDGLRASIGDELGPDAHELAKLEMMLRKTHVLVCRRNVDPKNEYDVQRVMHDYLGAFFTEFRKSVQIPGIIRDFKPDCGIRNLKAAVEFKFATTADEVSRAVGGVFEDISGYAGSQDWTRFYTVIYQTEPFDSEDRVRSELTRAGALTWTAFLVNGAGSRSQRKSASRVAKSHIAG